jgi:hypothetical protein
MRRHKSIQQLNRFGLGFLVLFVALAAAACSSGGHKTLTAAQLTTRILPAPYGYVVDPTPNASGAISPAVFEQYGGAQSSSKLGFVTGFKQNYINNSTYEGLIVTVMEFKSSKDASAYLTQTKPSTLSFAGATIKPFPSVPGAFVADGTKAYNGGYYHAVVDTANRFYFQVAYESPEPSAAPVELPTWAKLEYDVLKAS